MSSVPTLECECSPCECCKENNEEMTTKIENEWSEQHIINKKETIRLLHIALSLKELVNIVNQYYGRFGIHCTQCGNECPTTKVIPLRTRRIAALWIEWFQLAEAPISWINAMRAFLVPRGFSCFVTDGKKTLQKQTVMDCCKKAKESNAWFDFCTPYVAETFFWDKMKIERFLTDLSEKIKQTDDLIRLKNFIKNWRYRPQSNRNELKVLLKEIIRLGLCYHLIKSEARTGIFGRNELKISHGP